MPTKMKIEKRPKRVIPPGQVDYLLSGKVADGDVETFLLTRDRGAVRRAWKSVRDDLLRDWIEERPGTRPWAWWKFDLSEPRRRRIAGVGDLVPAYDHPSNVVFGAFGKNSFVDEGLLVAWRRIGSLKRGEKKFTAYDPNDPPTFESQATFLRRYNLFAEGEEKRLTDADFADEVVR